MYDMVSVTGATHLVILVRKQVKNITWWAPLIVNQDS